MPRPTCLTCGAPLRKPRHTTYALTADGRPAERGDYGDNAFCTKDCGYFFALRVLRSIGVADAIAMMPPDWRRAALAAEYREFQRPTRSIADSDGHQRLKLLRRARDHVITEYRKNPDGTHEIVPVATLET